MGLVWTQVETGKYRETGEHSRRGWGGWGGTEACGLRAPSAPIPPHLAAAVLQHHVHVLAVSKVSVEGYNVAMLQAAVQGDLPVHLQVWPHTSARRSGPGAEPPPRARASLGTAGDLGPRGSQGPGLPYHGGAVARPRPQREAPP